MKQRAVTNMVRIMIDSFIFTENIRILIIIITIKFITEDHITVQCGQLPGGILNVFLYLINDLLLRDDVLIWKFFFQTLISPVKTNEQVGRSDNVRG